MRFWFARNSEVSIHEQLVTQIVLGIVSGELKPGHRLPSTRDLARRFQLHANTVSAGYRHLEREGWVEFRRGSGVYVRNKSPESAAHGELALDSVIAGFFRSARDTGASLAKVRSRLQRWLSIQPPDHFLVIEPDVELRKIVIAEITQAVPFDVLGCAPEEIQHAEVLAGALPVIMPSKRDLICPALPEATDFMILKVRSVPRSLEEYLPLPTGVLVGVASCWPEFLKSSKTMLVAAGFQPESLVLRDARKPRWLRGLKQTAAVVCDCVTAALLPKECHAIVFGILAEESLMELARFRRMVADPVE